MSDIIFRTTRLTIRQLTHDDIEDFYIMQSNPNVMRYIKAALNYEETKVELSKFIDYYSDPDTFYNIWAVTTSEKDTLIGLCGVYQNQQSEYEIAYRLTESAWGNRYGGEITRSLIKHSLDILNLAQLVAYVYSENIPSVKILEANMDLVEETVHKQSGKLGRKYKISNN